MPLSLSLTFQQAKKAACLPGAKAKACGKASVGSMRGVLEPVLVLGGRVKVQGQEGGAGWGNLGGQMPLDVKKTAVNV